MSRRMERIKSSFRPDKSLRICFAAFICSSAINSAHAEVVSMLETSSGLTLATIGGIKQRKDTYSTTFDLRWLSFRSRIFALTGEYNYAKSGQYNRAAYQQTRVGFRYFPFSLGASFEDTYENAIIRYDSFLKPYFSGTFGFGRFLIEPVDSKAAAELSADYIVPGGALGATMRVTKGFAVGLEADVSYALSNSTVAFSALLIRPKLGLLLTL